MNPTVQPLANRWAEFEVVGDALQRRGQVATRATVVSTVLEHRQVGTVEKRVLLNGGLHAHLLIKIDRAQGESAERILDNLGSVQGAIEGQMLDHGGEKSAFPR